jgi:hypothetical protein
VGDEVKQPLVLEVKAPALPSGNGVAQLRAELDAVGVALDAIKGSFRQLARAPVVPQGFAEFKDQITDLLKTGRGSSMNPQKLAEAMGFGKQQLAELRAFAAEYRKLQQGDFRGGSVRSADAGARLFAAFNQHRRDTEKQMQAAFANFLNGVGRGQATMGQLHAGAEQVKLALGAGAIEPLEIPPGRIRLVLGKGTVDALVDSGALKNLPMNGPGGQFLPGNPGGGGNGRGVAGPGARAIQEYKDAVTLAKIGLETTLKGELTGNAATDAAARAKSYAALSAEMAKQLELREKELKLDERGSFLLNERAKIAKLERQAAASAVAGRKAGTKETFGAIVGPEGSDGPGDGLFMQGALAASASRRARQEEKWRRAQEKVIEQARIARHAEAEAERLKASAPPSSSSSAPKTPRAPAGANVSGFVEATEKVARWAASVALIYKAVEVLRFAGRSVIALDHQTQRLDTVFNQVGGTSRQLADDLLKEASAAGRSREEALLAGTAWAKLNLSRAQVGTAVKQTLAEANIEGRDAALVAEDLIDVYKGFHLTVKDLAPSLSVVNNLARTFGMEQKDVLQGLARSSPIARQYGLTLAQTGALIGGINAGTGQNGVTGSAALNGIAGSLADAGIQKTLRQRFGVDLAPGGEMKGLDAAIASLVERYNQLTDAEQKSMLIQINGRSGLKNLASLMDNYVQSQVLAINAQLHLNTAEVENAKIKKSLANELQGVSTEFERFVGKQAGNGAAQGLGLLAESLKNVLKLLNTGTGSIATTGFLGLLGVMGARLAVTKLMLDSAAASAAKAGGGTGGGWWGNSALGVVNAGRGLNGVLQGYVGQFAQSGGAAGRGTAAAFGWGQGLVASGQGNLVAAGLAPNRVGRMAQGGLGLGQMAVGGAASLAAGSVAALGPIALEVAAAVAIGTAAMWGFNRVMEAVGRSSDSSDKALAQANDELSEFAARAQAAAMAGKLFSTVINSLSGGNVSGSRAGQMLDLLGQLDSPFKLTPAERAAAERAHANGGRRADIEAALGPARERAMTEMNRAQRLQMNKGLETVTGLDAEYARLQGSLAPSQAALAKNRADRAEQVKRNLELAGRLDSGEAAEQFANADQRRLAVLEKTSIVMRTLSDLYQSMAGADATTRHTAELEAMKSQLAFAEEQDRLDQRRIEHSRELDTSRKAEADALIKQAEAKEALAGGGNRYYDVSGKPIVGYLEAEAAELRRQAAAIAQRKQSEELVAQNAVEARRPGEEELRSKIAARNSPETVAAVAQQARLENEAARARNEAGAFGVGVTDLERILDREHKLRELINREMAKAVELGASEAQQQDAKVRALEGMKMLVEAAGEADRRRFELERQYQQLLVDRKREFDRGNVTAGPEELLKRLAVSRLVQLRGGNLTREDRLGLGQSGNQILESLPGFGPEEQRLRREQRVAAGTPRGNALGLAAEQAQLLRGVRLRAPGGAATNDAGLNLLLETGRALGTEFGKMLPTVVGLRNAMHDFAAGLAKDLTRLGYVPNPQTTGARVGD